MIFYGGSFAAPAASDFLDGQKVTKEPPGGGRNRQKRLRRSCLHVALPLEPPLRGTRTCEVEQNFRRAKSERLSAVPSGPLGPGFAKIAAAAAPQPRLALPNQRLRRGFRRRGGCPHPPAPKWSASPVGRLRSKRAPSSVTASLCPFVPSGHFPLIGGVVLPPWRGKAWLGRHMRPLLQRCQNLAPSSASHSLGTFPLGGRFEIGNVGSAYSGAVRKPHQQQILSTQAPSGAGRKRRQALLILRAGTMAVQTRRASPVKRGPGKAVLWT